MPRPTSCSRSSKHSDYPNSGTRLGGRPSGRSVSGSHNPAVQIMDRRRHPARGPDRPTRSRPSLRPSPAHRPELPQHGATHRRRPARRDLGRPDAVRCRTRKPLTAIGNGRRSRQHGSTTFGADGSARRTRRSRKAEAARCECGPGGDRRRLEHRRGSEVRGTSPAAGAGPLPIVASFGRWGSGNPAPAPGGSHQPERES